MPTSPHEAATAVIHQPVAQAQPECSHDTQVATAPRKVGKYLVSPLIKVSGNGWFASAVSIRSGSGTGTTDRILRMAHLFPCAKEAAAHAHAEALQWIRLSHRPYAAT